MFHNTTLFLVNDFSGVQNYKKYSNIHTILYFFLVFFLHPYQILDIDS